MNPSKYRLIFRERVFKRPQERFFAIEADLRRKKFTGQMSLSGQSVEKESHGDIDIDSLLGIDGVERIWSIADVSPDKRFAAIYCEASSSLLNDDAKQSIRVGMPNIDDSYLMTMTLVIELKTKAVRDSLKAYPVSFSSDSKSVFYMDNWSIMKKPIGFAFGSPIREGQTFLVDPARNKMLVFSFGKIYTIYLRQKEAEVECDDYMGKAKAKGVAFVAGLVDEKWGYFMTEISPKFGAKTLYFVNLDTCETVKYPYKCKEGILLEVIPVDESP